MMRRKTKAVKSQRWPGIVDPTCVHCGFRKQLHYGPNATWCSIDGRVGGARFTPPRVPQWAVDSLPPGVSRNQRIWWMRRAMGVPLRAICEGFSINSSRVYQILHAVEAKMADSWRGAVGVQLPWALRLQNANAFVERGGLNENA